LDDLARYHTTQASTSSRRFAGAVIPGRSAGQLDVEYRQTSINGIRKSRAGLPMTSPIPRAPVGKTA
jgi:hypothetical protein